jgi:Cu/Ag efflux pump CusA
MLLGCLLVIVVLFLFLAEWRSTLLGAVVIPNPLLTAIMILFWQGGTLNTMVLAGGTISLGSLVGFVTILGIAARNGIMLLSHDRHLQVEENVGFGRALFLSGAEERLAPILMTALTTGLALVSLMDTGNISGQEIEYPLAFVILGGLVTSNDVELVRAANRLQHGPSKFDRHCR